MTLTDPTPPAPPPPDIPPPDTPGPDIDPGGTPVEVPPVTPGDDDGYPRPYNLGTP